MYIGDWDVDYTGFRNTTDCGFKRYICSISKLIKQDKTEPVCPEQNKLLTVTSANTSVKSQGPDVLGYFAHIKNISKSQKTDRRDRVILLGKHNVTRNTHTYTYKQMVIPGVAV